LPSSRLNEDFFWDAGTDGFMLMANALRACRVRGEPQCYI
jgi:hypothetical protein